MEKWKQRARTIKRDAHALYLAARDPRVPWYAKALAVAVAGYALSPIDLIPDVIPVIGWTDDALVLFAIAMVWLYSLVNPLLESLRTGLSIFGISLENPLIAFGFLVFLIAFLFIAVVKRNKRIK